MNLEEIKNIVKQPEWVLGTSKILWLIDEIERLRAERDLLIKENMVLKRRLGIDNEVPF